MNDSKPFAFFFLLSTFRANNKPIPTTPFEDTFHILINWTTKHIPLNGRISQRGPEPKIKEEGEKYFELSGGAVVLIIDSQNPPGREQRALKYSLKPALSMSF